IDCEGEATSSTTRSVPPLPTTDATPRSTRVTRTGLPRVGAPSAKLSSQPSARNASRSSIGTTRGYATFGVGCIAVAIFRVERATRKDDAAVATLARAFHDDPMFNFFMPHLVRQAHGLLAFMGASYYDAKPYDEIWVAHSENDKFAGAAVWLPPG